MFCLQQERCKQNLILLKYNLPTAILKKLLQKILPKRMHITYFVNYSLEETDNKGTQNI